MNEGGVFLRDNGPVLNPWRNIYPLIELRIIDPRIWFIVAVEPKSDEVWLKGYLVDHRNLLLSNIVDPVQLLEEEAGTVDPHAPVVLQQL